MGGEIHTGTGVADLAIPARSSKALVPIRSAAAPAASAASETSTASRVLHGASTTMKWAGRGLVVLGIAADVWDVATAPDGQKVRTAVNDTAGLAGGLAGATYGAEFGAEVGSLGGPVGTVVGGVVGGIVGGTIGSGVADSVVSGIENLF